MLQPIKISPLPEDLLLRLKSLGLTDRTKCYHNSIRALVQLAQSEPDIQYVVARVKHKDVQNWEGHALLFVRGHYVDATLEVQGLIEQCEYQLIQSFSPQETFSMLLEHGGEEYMRRLIDGRELWPNLCEIVPGKVGFDFDVRT
ncbi:hypothetical protein RY831_14855 [Noviherbaspirillum sp. CPCC 100848]|uniref:Uncharacterized protein n=1 Tax=Noviherbaspirillum album TaxID=3080276 RepID=A0ABU6J9V8_9BURK|nr:hypothetical protein [Noviherbaspirillum sp. CPCC 100848]MEC4720440.1 hypothetical protein [Noviherbaspirillum sp. CPCC 100848]